MQQMKMPDSDFFEDLDVLGLNNKPKDTLQAELSEETQTREPEQADADTVGEVTENECGQSDSEDVPQDGVSFNYDMTAKWVVNIMDGANKKYLPPLYRRKLYTSSEKKLVRRYDELEKQGQPYEITGADEQLLAKREKINALVEAVPMSLDEKTELAEALAEVMEGANVKVTPIQKLLMTLAIVEGARVIPLFTMKNDVVVE